MFAGLNLTAGLSWQHSVPARCLAFGWVCTQLAGGDASAGNPRTLPAAPGVTAPQHCFVPELCLGWVCDSVLWGAWGQGRELCLGLCVLGLAPNSRALLLVHCRPHFCCVHAVKCSRYRQGLVSGWFGSEETVTWELLSFSFAEMRPLDLIERGKK